MSQKRRAAALNAVTGWAFLAPYVLLLLLVGAIPAVYAFVEAFRDQLQPGFTLDNWVLVFDDFRFLPAVGNILIFAAVWIPIMIGGSLFFALLLHERVGRFSSTIRLVYFLPGAVAGSAAVMLWYFMLSPSVSPFRPALEAMGLTSAGEVFQDQNLVAIFTLIAFITGFGNWVVILFGAFQAVPHEIIEAARVDGAGPFRIALMIKVPLIGKYIVYMLILTFAAAVQIFVEPALFYSAVGAGSASWALNQLGYVFAFGHGDFGRAAVISVMLLIVCTIGALLLVFRTNFFKTEVDD